MPHSLRSGTTLTRYILYQAGTGTLCCTGLGRPVGGQFATHSHSDQGQLTRLIYQAMTSGTATLCCTRQRGTVCHTHSVRSGATLTRLTYIYIYIPGNDIRDSVLHSAGAPYSGTVCHTHSVRSGATLTRLIYIYIYQAMTSGTVCYTRLEHPTAGQCVTHTQ